jgi:transposase
VGFVLAGSYISTQHIARRIYLPESAPSYKGFAAQKTFVCKTKDISNFEFAEYGYQEPGGIKISNNNIKKLKVKDAQGLFDSSNLAFMAGNSIATIEFLKKIIKGIESRVKSQVKLRKEFMLLQTIPGIGNILALTIMLEIGDINRYKKVGNYASYCRCVKSQRLSDGKKKGENNKKNGNKYLAWAYVEAANFAVRHNAKAQRFYQRKKAKTNGIVAIKALSNKISRASYYIIRDQVPFDEKMLFG